MNQIQIENFIEAQYRELNIDSNEYEEYLELYKDINHNQLQIVFSLLHLSLISLFRSMNERLPTADDSAHFWAGPSRGLLDTIERIERMHRGLSKTSYAFNIEKDYQEIINKCKTFLERNGGSKIPPHMDKIELYYQLPIFISNNMVEISHPDRNKSYLLKQIGEGSYAIVFKYKDEYYNKYFVIKRAKKDLIPKEIERFKREFDEMSKLSSPYIVDVFCYNDEANEYVMEYMDSTLQNYIDSSNNNLSIQKRKNIVNQIVRAFSYLHSKGLLHRDISPNNILVKKYEDLLIVKIADFGLVKIPESDLTTINTEFKGSFNDPNLLHIGFDNYSMPHEIYALTRLIYFVMSGRKNTNSIDNIQLKEFVDKGLNTDESKRYKNIDELFLCFGKIHF